MSCAQCRLFTYHGASTAILRARSSLGAKLCLLADLVCPAEPADSRVETGGGGGGGGLACGSVVAGGTEDGFPVKKAKATQEEAACARTEGLPACGDDDAAQVGAYALWGVRVRGGGAVQAGWLLPGLSDSTLHLLSSCKSLAVHMIRAPRRQAHTHMQPYVRIGSIPAGARPAGRGHGQGFASR